jgi:hypothetical protein
MLRTIPISLALSLSLAAPAAAHAWPLGRVLHLNPATKLPHDISFQLFNASQTIRDVAVGDRKLTLQPKSGLRVTAPEGTLVIAGPATQGGKGEVLFAVQSSLHDNTVVIH